MDKKFTHFKSLKKITHPFKMGNIIQKQKNLIQNQVFYDENSRKYKKMKMNGEMWFQAYHNNKNQSIFTINQGFCYLNQCCKE